MVNVGLDDSSSTPSSTKRAQNTGRGRKKRWAPKARTGCLMCRTRRVKCDENKPFCYTCQRLGHECQYELNSKHVKEAQRNETTFSCPPGNRRPQRPIFTVQALTPSHGTSEETRYLGVYCSLSAPWFGRYSTRSLFTGVLPQASWHHPALRHALVAVAMASEQYHLGTFITRPYRRMWHYDQAVKHLYLDRQVHNDVVLMACALFFLHDNVMNDARSAIIHIQGFLKIAREHKLKKKEDRLDHELELAGLRTIRAFIYWGRSQDQIFAETPNAPTIAKIRERLLLKDEDYSDVFRGDDAEPVREELTLCTTATAWAKPQPVAADDPTSITFDEIQAFAEKWYRSTYLARPTLCQNDRTIIECHYRVFLLVLKAQRTVSEGGPSDLLNDTEGLGEVKLILDKIELMRFETMFQSIDTVDLIMPVMTVLGGVARLVPTADMQSRVFSLLKSMNRVEGLWNSNVVVALQEALAIETRKSNASLTTEEVA